MGAILNEIDFQDEEECKEEISFFKSCDEEGDHHLSRPEVSTSPQLEEETKFNTSQLSVIDEDSEQQQLF